MTHWAKYITKWGMIELLSQGTNKNNCVCLTLALLPMVTSSMDTFSALLAFCVNNREAGDLRRPLCVHYDVTIMALLAMISAETQRWVVECCFDWVWISSINISYQYYGRYNRAKYLKTELQCLVPGEWNISWLSRTTGNVAVPTLQAWRFTVNIQICGTLEISSGTYKAFNKYAAGRRVRKPFLYGFTNFA